MRSLQIALLGAILVAASAAHAQVSPPAGDRPAGGTPAVAPSPLDELPAAMAFKVLRVTSGVGFRGHRVRRYHTSEPYPASAQRLRTWERSARFFGGGYRLIGYSHQFEGDKWFFTLAAPNGEHYRIGLERDAGGSGSLLTIDQQADSLLKLKSRRPYHRQDLGPRP